MLFSKQTIKNSLFTLCTILLFFVAAIIYCAPQMSGQKLVQHDVQQYEGMAKDILDNRAATGEDAQWTGGMFGGMPAYLINVLYPSQAVKGTIGKVVKVIDTPASFLFFTMTAMWLAMLLFGVNAWVAIIAALAYGFSTYFILIIGAGHITKMWALMYAPLMMGGAYYTLRRNLWVGGALTALFTSLEIGANHPQITYYFLLAMVALWLSEGVYAIKEKTLKDFAKRTAVLAAAGIIGVGSNLSPLWQTMQHSKETTRGGSELATAEAGSGADGLDLEYATAWSYGKAESLNLFVPNFMGGASTDTFSPDGPVAEALRPYGLEQMAEYMSLYRGEQPYTAGPTYLGAAAIFLAVMALILLPNRQRWWIVGASVAMLLLSWGNNLMWFTELLFNILPGYNKFRTLSMSQVVIQWTVPLLAALGVSVIVSGKADKEKIMNALKWAVGVTGGVLLVMIIGGRSLGDYGMQESGEMLSEQMYQMLSQQDGEEFIKQGLHEHIAWSTASAMVEERVAAMRADAWRSLLFVLLAAGAVLAYVKQKFINNTGVLCIVLTVIVAADLINVDTRYLNYDSFVDSHSVQLQPTAADLLIMQDKDPDYRVLNLTVSPFNDATTSYFHRSVGGYHGAKLSHYQDLINVHLNNLNEGVLDMLNVRYIIDSPEAEGVYKRETANGAAWMVQSVARASTAQDEIDLVGRIDTKREAVMTDEFLPKNFNFSEGTISLEEYRPNYLRYEANAEGDALVVFSEIFTREGWTVTIDGQEARPLRADYVLRAVEMPAGSHTIEWRYRAPNWALIEGIAWAFSIVTLIGFILTLIYLIRNAGRQKNQA